MRFEGKEKFRKIRSSRSDHQLHKADGTFNYLQECAASMHFTAGNPIVFLEFLFFSLIM